MEALFYRFGTLFITILIYIFSVKYNRKKIVILPLALFFIPNFLISADYLTLYQSAFTVAGFLYFLILVFASRDYFQFKLSFYGCFFMISYLLIFILKFIIKLNLIYFFALELIPLLAFIFMFTFIFKTSRISLKNPFFKLALSVVIVFPFILFILNFVFPNLQLDSFADVALFSFVSSVIVSLVYTVVVPILGILSPILNKINTEQVNYLTSIIEIEKKEGLERFTESFLNSKIPAKDINLKPEDEKYTIEITEKKSRPLFSEEMNFVNLIERELNIRYRNILVTQKLREKLDEISILQDEIAEIKLFSIVGEMLATISHQLRTPVAILRNSMELLRSEELTELEQDDVLVSIEQEIEHINDIVEKFLDFISKKECETSAISIKSFTKNIISNHFDKYAEKIVVKGQEREIVSSGEFLEEILIILIQNALEAVEDTEGGRVEVILKEETITVRDNGQPIKKSDASVFDPFYTTKAKGVGLGLTICKRLCNVLGIELTLKEGRKWKYFILKWRNNEENTPG